MTAYEILWDFAEDHYGIVTTSQAVAMGIDKHQLPAMATLGNMAEVFGQVFAEMAIRCHAVQAVPNTIPECTVGTGLPVDSAAHRGLGIAGNCNSQRIVRLRINGAVPAPCFVDRADECRI